MSGQLNVNQFALPGMEEHAHAGAKALSEGRGFRYEHEMLDEYGGEAPRHALEMYAPNTMWKPTPNVRPRMEKVGRLAWLDSSAPPPQSPDPTLGGEYAGEIQGVFTNNRYQRQGIATTLYDMAMDPKVHTGDDTLPLHSPFRTTHGHKWSAAVGGWDPDEDPVEDRPRHPYEEREGERVKDRRPELPGQQRLPI